MWHLGPETQEKDERRHRDLIELGYEVIYVTWTDAIDYADTTLHTIERLLLARGWRPWAA